MGNRAIIKAETGNIGLYLHWNGGRDSVTAFLEYCKLKGYRSPETDGYGWARLAQVVGNFFGGTTSLGIVSVTGDHDGEYCDNGAYIIKNWQIIGREDYDLPEQNVYPLDEMLDAIDERQPEPERIGKYLHAQEIEPGELKIGDQFYSIGYDGALEEAVVAGIGEPGKIINGQDVGGVPYIDRYGDKPENNINNYILHTVRRAAEPGSVTKVNYNAELHGIEIQFADKPDAETREKLKAAGFRWHKAKKVWYAKETQERKEFAESL